jgi:hypothetical protein
MHTYTTISKNERYESNFSLYHRPPAFVKRQSGKIILLSIATFILAFIYPVTYWTLNYTQTLHKDLLQQKYKEIHNVRSTRESTLKSKKVDKDKAIALLKAEKKEYNDKKSTLVKIHDVKVNYPMKAKLLAKLIKDLNKFGVKMESLSYKEEKGNKEFLLNLVSAKDRKITKLVYFLTKEHDKIFKFELEEILYDDENHLYFSQLKVRVL